MEFIDESIQNYCEKYSNPEDNVLQELSRETHLKVLTPRMLSGHLQGNILSAISYMIRPKNILEIGTYTGYSAICMAKGLQEDGKLITIDVNEELEEMCNRYFEKAGMQDKIQQIIGNATEIIPKLNETFDLVFIDADKANYSLYFDQVIDKMSIGGFIMADNVLWSGKILNEKKDKQTQALHDFNKKALESDRVENVILPVRDGIHLIRKIK